eukprot:gb/GFBE01049292.1/.p1 GENE.gb/GFBE01049292.1/~~gb/GFBE01049292.1/.p1  ORF type:complete len:1049 (+),score=245.41 gb/GFBE01049292.1/:1-3147(+)
MPGLAPKRYVQCVVEADGISLQDRLGKVAEVPAEDLAFITDETLAQVIEPSALNSGNVVDIFQQREDDFEAIQPLEISFRNPQGKEVKETVFVDSLALSSRGPRICVCVSHVHAMHRAIGVLTRKVDNLTMTLRSCREHYYKELFSLRYGREPEGEHEKYWFSPKAYEDNVTKELVRERLGVKEKQMEQLIKEKDVEIKELRKQLSSIDDVVEKKVSDTFMGTSLKQLFDLLVEKNAFRKVDFVNHVLRLGQELADGLEFDKDEDSKDSDFVEKARTKQALKTAELQVAALEQQMMETEAANKSLMDLATSPSQRVEVVSSNSSKASSKMKTFARRRGAVEAMKTMTMKEICDTESGRARLVPEAQLLDMTKQAEAWEREARELSVRVKGLDQDLSKMTSKADKGSKELEKSRKHVATLERRLATELTTAYMQAPPSPSEGAKSPTPPPPPVQEEAALSIEEAMQQAAELAALKGVRQTTLDHIRRKEEAKRRAEEEAQKFALNAVMFKSAAEKRKEERKENAVQRETVNRAQQLLEQKKGTVVWDSSPGKRRSVTKEALADCMESSEEELDARQAPPDSEADTQAAIEAALAQANDMSLSDEEDDYAGDSHAVPGAHAVSPSPTRDLQMKASSAAKQAFSLLQEARQHAASAHAAKVPNMVDAGTQTLISCNETPACWSVLPWVVTTEDAESFPSWLRCKLLHCCVNFVHNEEPSVIKMPQAADAVSRRLAALTQVAKPRISIGCSIKRSRAVQRMKTIRQGVVRKLDAFDQANPWQRQLSSASQAQAPSPSPSATPHEPSPGASTSVTPRPSTPGGMSSFSSRPSTPGAAGIGNSRVPTPGIARTRGSISPDLQSLAQEPEGLDAATINAVHRRSYLSGVPMRGGSMQPQDGMADSQHMDVELVLPTSLASQPAQGQSFLDAPSPLDSVSPSMMELESSQSYMSRSPLQPPSHRSQMAKLAELARPTAAGSPVRIRPRSSGRVAGQMGTPRWRPEVAKGGFTNRNADLILEGLPSNSGTTRQVIPEDGGEESPSHGLLTATRTHGK